MEVLEDPRLLLGGDPDPGVGDGDRHLPRLRPVGGGDGDRAARGELDGVAQEVQQDLLHLGPVAAQARQRRLQVGQHTQARLRDDRLHLGHHLGDQLGHVELAHVNGQSARLDAG